MLLFIRSLFWTILIPGAVTVYFPSLMVDKTSMPGAWGFLQWLALPMATIGTVALLQCIVDFAVAGRGTLSPADAPRRLVVKGLYRYVRNPMYCGVLLVILAEAAFFKSVALLEYCAGWLLLMHFVVVLYEEPALRRQFGDSYNEYSRVVHRWLPGRPYNT
jgi:protein-S-isoprenylcysteine O-methyltransferase Ste14